jgi:hypothetical protein
MSRKKRKHAMALPEREGNGRHKRPSPAELKRLQKEALLREARRVIGTVLDQPHRRGNRDQLCENALGRFVINRKLARELYDAGQEYAGIVYQHKRLMGLPGTYSNGPGMGHGHDDPEIADKIERLRVRQRDAYSCMRPSDAAPTRWLCVEAGPMEDVDLSDATRCERITYGLLALAKHFGLRP